MAVLPTPDQICRLLQAKRLVAASEAGAQPVRSISTDSRNLEYGDAFVALRGDRFDGHNFVASAVAAGAAVAIVDQAFALSSQLRTKLSETDRCSILQVEDSLKAYQALGQHWRQQFSGPVVAVTGSVGKTTMKELIAAMLGTQGPVLKTQANFNNEIGVPKTLLELVDRHRYAVVEMGMRGLGEIELLAQIAKPDVAIITNVGTAHIERLGSEAAIAQAKCELLQGLKPDGVAVLNADNPRLMERAKQVWSGQTITFGLDKGDVRGEIQAEGQLAVGDHRFQLPLPGRHNALNFCGALAVARALNISWETLTDLELTLPGGRSQRYDLSNGIALLDETYNAGAESMVAALQLLAQTPGQRRIAVLGTMKELGDHSLRLHRQVGAAVAEQNIDLLLTLADPAEAEALVQGAAGVECRMFQTADALVDGLKTEGQEGDRILFKASRAVALDQVVEQLKAHWQ